ncbi:hypothetical protein [Paenarthrobacter aurescens]|uniref:hypothetical protein n=1 Tax=Paenarthrobacter aurescens TaxID=43663 RepID=UPI001EE18DF7|nr:hypothetical protein [Paenarthrobacter aurescens]
MDLFVGHERQRGPQFVVGQRSEGVRVCAVLLGNLGGDDGVDSVELLELLGTQLDTFAVG